VTREHRHGLKSSCLVYRVPVTPNYFSRIFRQYLSRHRANTSPLQIFFEQLTALHAKPTSGLQAKYRTALKANKHGHPGSMFAESDYLRGLEDVSPEERQFMRLSAILLKISKSGQTERTARHML